MTSVDLDAAWDALEDGRPDEALVRAARAAPDGDGERSLVEGNAFLDLGLFEAARGAHERAAEALGADDLAVTELAAELALRSWDLDAARERFEALAAADFEPRWWERRALLADLADDFERADALAAEAHARDPEGAPLPAHLPPEEFDRVVEEAIASLPEMFRGAIARARLVREPVPSVELASSDAPLETPPDLLGLFVGPTLHELAEDRSAELPPVVHLFERNLARACRDADELREEIRVTLFHEVGHLLGLDEDEVAAMGLA